MEEIIVRQRDAARPLAGRGFLLGVAGIVIRLAIAQLVVNLAITLSGVGLLNVCFYLYAIVVLFTFMRHTVASYVYTLKRETLVLERQLGDSTTSVIEIPLLSVLSVLPVKAGENLRLSYKQVTVIDPAGKPPLRVRIAFPVSLVSARLARALAGKAVQREVGYAVIYQEGGSKKACVIRPNGPLLEALTQALPEAIGFDERMTHAPLRTLYARALQRAFPALYPYVTPLVHSEDVQWAQEELAGRKAARHASRAPAGAAAPGKKEETDQEEGKPENHRRAPKNKA